MHSLASRVLGLPRGTARDRALRRLARRFVLLCRHTPAQCLSGWCRVWRHRAGLHSLHRDVDATEKSDAPALILANVCTRPRAIQACRFRRTTSAGPPPHRCRSPARRFHTTLRWAPTATHNADHQPPPCVRHCGHLDIARRDCASQPASQ